MRKLIVTNIMSIDGYYEGPRNDVMAMNMDPAFDAYNVERLRAADTLLVGRTSYLGFVGYWPSVADAPEDDRAHSDANREISRLNNRIAKTVVSDSLTPDDLGAWRDTTTIVRRSEIDAEIAALKAAPGRDILVFGSRTLWNELLERGHVDELHLVVGPVPVGGGSPIFTRPAPAMRLLDTRRFDGSDNVVLRYATSPA